MPRYDYECGSCGHVFELRQSFDDEPRGTCPLCSGMSKRKFHAVPIIYKGSGFYTTDYKNSGYSSASDNGKEEGKEKNESAKAGTDKASTDKKSSDTKVSEKKEAVAKED